MMLPVIKKIILLFTFIAMLCCFFPAKAESERFTATASHTEAMVGQQIQVSFELRGTGKNFQAPTFSGFDVLAGPSQSTSMQIMNGSMSQSITFTYILSPVSEGTFKIGSASIESEGKKLQSNTLSIVVSKNAGSSPPGANNKGEATLPGGKNVFLRVSIDKNSAYVGEGIIATYKLYTSVNLINYSITKIPALDGFWSQEVQLPQQLEFYNENVDGVAYRVANVKKLILFPQRSGSLTLDPMEGEVIARIQVKRQQSKDPFDQFFNDPFFNNPFFNNSVQDRKIPLRSDPVRVQVRELPSPAPTTFTGAVGNFTVDYSIDSENIKANDAVTLKIKITGKGNLKLIDPPSVSVHGDFESYDPKVNLHLTASSSGLTGSKTFEYLYIPRNAGEYKLPVSSFTYFDLSKQQYITIPGKDFLLKVAKGSENISATSISGVSKSDVQFLGKDIRFIKVTPLLLINRQPFHRTVLFYVLLMLPALLFTLLVFYRKRYQALQSNVTLLKSRKANKVAMKRLSTAKKLLREKQDQLFLDEMFKAMWGYVSDKFQIPVADLNKENVGFSMKQRNVSDETSNQFLEVINLCERARFAPFGVSNQETIFSEGIRSITQIEEEAK